MKSQPLIAVSDVQAASAWYRELLGCKSGHGSDTYEQLTDAAGDLVLQINHWDAHEHDYLGDQRRKPYGNGVLMWFEVDDFDEIVTRIEGMTVPVLDGPFVNKNAGHREVWLRDPEGYVVVLASPQGDVTGH
ncbi:VOC family protein [Marinobacter fonticola]|uniref:VOC family protein n=1 Tax=Marinobacter fonticola TaxID=2603215 RepID=UPI0011E80D6A|nr:VOC family protein [Marinobacter fonticola]